jgi:hypothetical protein
MNRIRRIRPGAVLIAASVIAVGVASVATGATGDVIRIGKRTAGSGETAIVTNSSGYSTRQSNSRNGDGGAASYGCRANAGREACLYVLNHENGNVFRFVGSGENAGRIEVRPPSGKTADDVKPLTTNANGVATGFNADEVDGRSADEIVAAAKPLVAAVSADGTGTGTGLAQSNALQKTGTGAYTVSFGASVASCAYTATETTTTDAGAAAVQQVTGNANALNVVTRDAGGAAADRPFHLVVNC